MDSINEDITLLILSRLDRRSMAKVYLQYIDLLHKPSTLTCFAEQHGFTISPETFADYLFMLDYTKNKSAPAMTQHDLVTLVAKYDLFHMKDLTHKLCSCAYIGSPFMKYVVQLGKIPLIRRLVGDTFDVYISYECARQNKISEELNQSLPYVRYGKDILRIETGEDVDWQMYSPSFYKQRIRVTAEERSLEIGEFSSYLMGLYKRNELFDKFGHKPNRKYLYQGYLEGGHLDLIPFPNSLFSMEFITMKFFGQSIYEYCKKIEYPLTKFVYILNPQHPYQRMLLIRFWKANLLRIFDILKTYYADQNIDHVLLMVETFPEMEQVIKSILLHHGHTHSGTIPGPVTFWLGPGHGFEWPSEC